MIAWPEPNNKYIIHPNALITAINKKTAGQLCVTCRMCPEKYTPRKPEKKKKENILAVHATDVYINYLPGIAPTVFIRPNTLPECFGARSEGLTAIALLWKPEPPIINARQSMAFSKLSTFAIGNMFENMNVI